MSTTDNGSARSGSEVFFSNGQSIEVEVRINPFTITEEEWGFIEQLRLICREQNERAAALNRDRKEGE